MNKMSFLLVFFAAIQLMAAVPFELISRSLPSPSGVAPSGNSGGYLFDRERGRILFSSDARDLVGARTEWGSLNVYLLDLASGGVSIVSTNRAGEPSNRPSLAAGFGGGKALFVSEDESLVDDDGNELADAFVHDADTGSIRRIGRTSPASGMWDGHVRQAVLSGDGSKVVFVTESLPNAFPPIFGGGAYLHDFATGSTRVLSTNSAPESERPRNPLISHDGQTVVLSDPSGSYSVSNLVELVVFRGTNEPFRPNLAPGLSGTPGYRPPPVDAAAPVLSDNGRYLAFLAHPTLEEVDTESLFWMDLDNPTDIRLIATGLPRDPFYLAPDGRTLAYHLYQTNRVAGIPGRRLRFWNVDSGDADFDSLLVGRPSASTEPQGASCPVFSPDRARVVYVQENGAVTPTSTNIAYSLVVRDLATGETRTLAGPFDGDLLGEPGWLDMDFLADGRSLLVETRAPLVSADSNRSLDLYRVPTDGGRPTLLTTASTAASPGSGSGASQAGSGAMSADGRYVVFTSDAQDLVTEDRNGYRDVFLRDRKLGVTRIVSISTNGLSANGTSIDPWITPDGRYVFFRSNASDLEPLSSSTERNAFQMDVFRAETETGRVRRFLRRLSPEASASIPWYWPSPDGERMIFVGTLSAFLPPAVDERAGALGLSMLACEGPGGAIRSLMAPNHTLQFRLDRQNHAFLPQMGRGGVSASGRRVVYPSRAYSVIEHVLIGTDLLSGTHHLLITNLSGGETKALAIGADGERVAALVSRTDGSGRVDLWAGRFEGGTLARVADFDSVAVPPSLQFTPDGTQVVVSVQPSNTGGPWGLLMYPAGASGSSVTPVVLDRSNSGSLPNARSDSPVFSADGRRIVFRSAASNLTDDDDNGVTDLFARDLPDGPLVRVTRGADQLSNNPSLDPAGGLVVFGSFASGLSSLDHNSHQDVFLASVDLPEKLPISLRSIDGGLVAEFISRPDRVYRFERRDDLDSGEWSVEPGTLQGDGFGLAFRIVPGNGQKGFFRIASLPR